MLPYLLNFKVVIDVKNYETYIGQNVDTPLVIMYHMDWCGHCRHAKPIFDQMQEYFADDQEVMTTAVECESNRELCDKFKKNGYPSYSYFIHGNETSYWAKPYFQNMLDLTYKALEAAYGSNVTQIENQTQITQFPSFEFQELPDNFTLLNYARYLMRKPEFQKVVSYYSKSNDAGLNGTLKVRSKGNNEVVCKKELTLQNIINFLMKFTSDIRENWDFQTILQSDKIFSIFIPSNSLDNLLFRKFAKHFSNYSAFAHSKVVGSKSVMAKFDVEKKDLPAIVAFNPSTQKFSKLLQASNVTQVESFYRSITQGTATEQSYDLQTSILETFFQNNLAVVLMCLAIGVSIVSVTFYSYNVALGNLKKID